MGFVFIEILCLKPSVVSIIFAPVKMSVHLSLKKSSKVAEEWELSFAMKRDYRQEKTFTDIDL